MKLVQHSKGIPILAYAGSAFGGNILLSVLIPEREQAVYQIWERK